MFSFSNAFLAAKLTPYPVASVLARDPPNSKGFPVNTPFADFPSISS